MSNLQAMMEGQMEYTILVLFIEIQTDHAMNQI